MSWVQDIRFSLKILARSKGFTLASILAFALGIGATATIFSVIDTVLLRPVPFRDSDSLVHVEERGSGQDWDGLTPGDFRELRARKDLFRTLAACRISLFTVTHVPNPDQMFGRTVTGNLFPMLGTKPLLGRTIAPSDEAPNAPKVVLLSYQAWNHLVHGDPGIVNRTMVIDGEPHRVVGVMPEDFEFLEGSNVLWVPLKLTAADFNNLHLHIEVIGQLQNPGTLAQLQAALNVEAHTLEREHPKEYRNWQIRAQAWTEGPEHRYVVTLWLMLGVVAGLLIIACANIASLLLARALRRQRDFAIRLATGASKWQLVRQALMEVWLLALTGTMAGTAVAWAITRWIRIDLAASPLVIPNLSRVHVDARVLAFSFLLSLFAALISGLLPTFTATRVDVTNSLRESGATAGAGLRLRRSLHVLITGEVAVAMLLLLTSGLLLRSLIRLEEEDHGIRPNHVLTMRLPMGAWERQAEESNEKIRKRRIAQYEAFLARIQNVSGVQAAALVSSLPLSNVIVRSSYLIPGHLQTSSEDVIYPMMRSVTSDYFRAMGTPLLEGRSFSVHDAAADIRAALVNQSFAVRYFGQQDPVGQEIVSTDHGHQRVIGVVRNSAQLDYDEKAEPEVYVNFHQELITPFLTGIVVRTVGDPMRLANTLRREILSISPNQAVVNIKTLEQLVNNNIWRPRFSSWLFGIFSALALVLTLIGIYGVVAYVTSSRTQEFGVRSALGAGPRDLFVLTLLQSLLPVALGTAIGIAGALLAGRTIQSLLYETSITEPAVYGAVTLLLLAVAALASAIPALRAWRIDPATVLRHE